jgi:ligand-binding sensor domain-containing protein/signal transduction histidine kinase
MKTRLQIYGIVLILLCLKAGSAFSQQIIFNKVPPPDGKTFDFVTGITQDLDGIMWFSTKKGLYSYDGNLVTSYKNNPLNPNSIISNLLESVYADTSGNIWVGSLGKGLDLYERSSGVFIHFHHDPDDPGSLINDTVTSILRDRQGKLWIATHQGLDQYDPVSGKFIHFRYKADDSTSLSNNQVRVLYLDKQGTLWIGTGSPYPNDGGRPEDGGLNRFNRETGTFTRFLHDPNDVHSLLSNKVSAIYEDSHGILWIGTSGNGLHKMDRQHGTFERLVYDPAHPEKFSGPEIDKGTGSYEHICFITEDAEGSYWFGTVDAGLYYFNPGAGKIVKYRRTENASSEYSDNGAFKTFTSRDNILWIGGTQGNIYHIDPLRKEIPHTLIPGATVNSFYEDPYGSFWIGTSQDLIRIDKNTGIEKKFIVNPNAGNTDDNGIFIICGDRQDNLWVGSPGGLNLLDRKNEKFIHYKHNPKNNNSLSNKYVISLYEDSEANFWVGTFNGLNLLDRKTGSVARFFLYPADTSSFGLNVITSILEDSTGKLWVSSWNGAGISQFNLQDKKFRIYLKGSSIMSTYIDKDGILWAGGTDGLYKYNRDIDDFVRYTDPGSPTGIPDVLSIVEDDQRYLWIGTSEGIVRLNPQRNETSLYGKSYGIGENTLSLGCYKRKNGEIIFGDATGYFSFSPVNLIQNLKTPEIVFTGFRLANRIVNPGDGAPVNGRLSQIPAIRLQHDENVFSFDFAEIDYANPEENRLIYFLENYDNQWYQAGSDQRAYYFNIPPGKYVFRVKAVNSYGVWAEKKIDVIILPPWWGTWWAYCIYGIVFIAAIFGFDRFQRRRLLDAERERTRERELAQAKEVEKAYKELKVTQAQLIHSEKMASLGELTAGIAHEIQNPLNFVNNFSEVSVELVDEMKQELAAGSRQLAEEIAEDIKQNLQKINHHGKRADAIVKGMLQHSRTSTGQKEPTDINALADEYLRLSYHGLRAKDKSFNADFKTDFDETLPKINVIAQDIGRVLLNLVNNAFYAVSDRNLSGLKTLTGSEYKPTVIVTTNKIGNMLEIRVKDNGNGIPANILEKIFQPFFTTKPTGQGTGLGLSLSYDIVRAHGGELKVETKESSGTTFIIQMPIQE